MSPLALLDACVRLQTLVPNPADWTDARMRSRPEARALWQAIRQGGLAVGIGDPRRLLDGRFLTDSDDRRFGLTALAVAAVILATPAYHPVALACGVPAQKDLDAMVELAGRFERGDLLDLFRRLQTARALRIELRQTPDGTEPADLLSRVMLYPILAENPAADTAVDYLLGLLIAPDVGRAPG